MSGPYESHLEEDATPTVTVVLCTHNRANLIERAVSSVIAQTYQDWELLIIDDGSTDDTADVVKPLVHADHRLRYHHWANRGLATARNWGIEMARGAFTTFLDDDDEYEPNHLGKRMAHVALSTSVEFLHGGFRIVGPEGSDMVPDMNDPSKMIPIRDCIVGGTFFGKTDVFRATHGFRPIYGTDNDLFRRIIARGIFVDEIRAETYIYHRDVEDSMCDAHRREVSEGEEDESPPVSLPLPPGDPPRTQGVEHDTPVPRLPGSRRSRRMSNRPAIVGSGSDESEIPLGGGPAASREEIEADMDIGI